jgi:dTDP-4-dehydrorhamnose 3,5-epimerase|tara:strand:- start:10131 stop:10709 length:579 start_codon:yes stop_codon:yes gene_type:complete
MIMLEDLKNNMVIEEQILEKVLLFKPDMHKDERGYFFESFKESIFEENGYNIRFVQDNEAFSKYSGTLRGLHYQLRKPQGKLLHVVSGAIKDVVVDIRKGSPDFGKSIMINLNSASHNMIYIPEGFAHGYLALEDNTIIQYKCTNYYDSSSEYGVKWDDEDINIDWDISDPILSDKDKNFPKLKDQNNLPIY